MNAILRTEKLCKTFSNEGTQQHVIKNMDLEIMEKDFTIIMGSSGSGKSTLLYALSGMDKSSMGKVFFGTRERAWNSYISAVFDSTRRIDRRLLFVTYVGLTQNDLDMIRVQIEKRMTFERIIFQKASPAIAVNCGSGTFGLLFKTKDSHE